MDFSKILQFKKIILASLQQKNKPQSFTSNITLKPISTALITKPKKTLVITKKKVTNVISTITFKQIDTTAIISKPKKTPTIKPKKIINVSSNTISKLQPTKPVFYKCYNANSTSSTVLLFYNSCSIYNTFVQTNFLQNSTSHTCYIIHDYVEFYTLYNFLQQLLNIHSTKKFIFYFMWHIHLPPTDYLIIKTLAQNFKLTLYINTLNYNNYNSNCYKLFYSNHSNSVTPVTSTPIITMYNVTDLNIIQTLLKIKNIQLNIVVSQYHSTLSIERYLTTKPQHKKKTKIVHQTNTFASPTLLQSNCVICDFNFHLFYILYYSNITMLLLVETLKLPFNHPNVVVYSLENLNKTLQ